MKINVFNYLKASAILVVFAWSATSVEMARADRCVVAGSSSMSCQHNYKIQWYQCNGLPLARAVRWQVPEGTPPPGGWPVAFFFNGTSPADTNPFTNELGTLFGFNFSPQIIHELLDDPQNSGKRYAVIAPEPPQSAALLEFWNTNLPVPYSTTCDYDYFPELFSELKTGGFGAASQYDMDRRYAYGISSGGYNTSRMAVTFNQKRKWYQKCDEWCNEDSWRALGVISASYATCTGPVCVVPSIPSNHPPTKFWHGHSDLIVPKFTADWYFESLWDDNVPVEFHEHTGGHELHPSNIGNTGVKAWFDLFD